MNQEKPWFEVEIDHILKPESFAVGRNTDPKLLVSERGYELLQRGLEAIVAEAERRGREKALEEMRKAAFKTVVPLSLTPDGEGGTESVDIVAVPKSFFES